MMNDPDFSDLTACLHCGADMKYDWMACPKCGWRADEASSEEDDPEESPRRVGLSGPWVKWVAWALLAALAFLVMLGLF